MTEKFFFSRHTERADDPKTGKQTEPESAKYKGITERGVERAEKQAQQLIEMIDEAPRDGIVFVGGASEEARTKSTAHVFGDTLEQHYQGNPDVIVVSEASIAEQQQQDKNFSLRSYVEHLIADNADKKIIMTHPLFLQQLSLRPYFRDATTGEQTAYTKALYEAGGGEEEQATQVLMSGTQNTDEATPGVTPQQLAENHIKAMTRLRTFTKRFAQGRETIVGLVGHAWNLDALAAYLANQGVSNSEAFQKTGNKMIEPSEIGVITIDDATTHFTYRGQTYDVPPDILKPKE